jgi:hypothetical protein
MNNIESYFRENKGRLLALGTFAFAQILAACAPKPDQVQATVDSAVNAALAACDATKVALQIDAAEAMVMANMSASQAAYSDGKFNQVLGGTDVNSVLATENAELRTQVVILGDALSTEESDHATDEAGLKTATSSADKTATVLAGSVCEPFTPTPTRTNTPKPTRTPTPTRTSTLTPFRSPTVVRTSTATPTRIIRVTQITEAPPTVVTPVPPTEVPPTQVPPTEVPPTQVPPTATEVATNVHIPPTGTTGPVPTEIRVTATDIP